MISKMVTDRKKTATDLGAALHVHTSEASAALQEMLEPFLLEGDTVPDLPMLQRLLGRRLAFLKAQLVDADERHSAGQRGDKVLRQIRDDATRELANLIGRLRGAVDRVCGQSVCQSLWGLEGAMPRDPVVVQSVTTRVLTELRKGSFQLTGDPLPGFQMDPIAWVERLEKPMARLDEALDQLAQENRETLESNLAKSRILAEYDRSYQATARILEEFFRYVGITDLSERVRPNQRSQASESEETELQGAALEVTDPVGFPSEDPPPKEVTVEARAAPTLALKTEDSDEPTN